MPNANLDAMRAAAAKKRKKQAGKIIGGRNYVPKKVQAEKAAECKASAASAASASIEAEVEV